MAKSKPKDGQEKSGQERIQFNIRMPVALRTQLELLAEQNLTDVSAEIVAACLDRLKTHGMWPPLKADSK